jgi:hypothetical protein
MGSGHFRRAAGIFAEIADDLNREAEEADGLMSEEVFTPADTAASPKQEPFQPVHSMEFCMKNVHSYGAVDERGWRECVTCGHVNVAPPEEA